jgi:TatD DNase family protein
VLGLSSVLEEDPLEVNTDLYATVGCHPTRSAEFEKDPSGYFQALDKLIDANLSGPGRAVAVGECGLDYDRTHFASTIIQQKHFRGHDYAGHCFCIDETLTGSQLALAKKHHLPLFLHSRAAHNDFVQILREEGFGEDGGRAVGGRGGVVHSFTGSPQDAIDYVRARDLPSQPDITKRNTQINMGFHVRFVLQ